MLHKNIPIMKKVCHQMFPHTKLIFKKIKKSRNSEGNVPILAAGKSGLWKESNHSDI